MRESGNVVFEGRHYELNEKARRSISSPSRARWDQRYGSIVIYTSSDAEDDLAANTTKAANGATTKECRCGYDALVLDGEVQTIARGPSSPPSGAPFH